MSRLPDWLICGETNEVTEWIDGGIGEFNESTLTNNKIFAIIPGLDNPAMLPTHE